MKKVNDIHNTRLHHQANQSYFPWLYTLCLMLSLALPASAKETVIHAGHLLAVPGKPIQEKVSLITENGLIKAIKKGFVDGETVIDLSDSYVLPGLIDMHAHIASSISEEEKYPRMKMLDVHTANKSALALKAIPYIRQTLRAGFTTVRGLGDPGGVIFDLRNAVNQGIIDGPRIIAAQTQISVTNGEYDPARLGVRPNVENTFDNSGLCDGPYACRRTVRRLVAEGADVIKLRIAGNGAIFNHSNVFEYEDEIEAVINTAHRLGRRVAVHVASEKAAIMVLKAGADTIEHGPLPREGFKLAKKAYFTPTLLVQKENKDTILKFSGRDIYSSALKTVGEAYRAGVPILFGSDSGAIPHSEAAKEFGLLVEAGLSNEDAIKAATVTASEALGLSQMIGTLEPGKAADIIATTENPLTNINTLEQVAFVMKGGKVF